MIEKIEPFKVRLQKALDIRDMKAVDVCRKTGIREGAMSQYRSGYAEPKADKLQMIAEALNVDPVWLMGMNVPMEKEKVEMNDENARILASLMRDSRFFSYMKKATNLSADKKEVLYSYIDFLLSSANH